MKLFFEYHFDNEEDLINWKEKYKIPEAASAEEAFYLFRDKYNKYSNNENGIKTILLLQWIFMIINTEKIFLFIN